MVKTIDSMIILSEFKSRLYQLLALPSKIYLDEPQFLTLC